MTADSASKTIHGRIVSLDALRGFDMFFIIGGASLIGRLLSLWESPLSNILERQLHHSEWHGFTHLDLIFPLFLFIVGTSIPVALARKIETGMSRKSLYLRIVRRTLILYFLGMIIEAGRIDALGGLRYTGVLHRIAFCYLITSVIVLNSRIRTQAILTAGLLVMYWLAMSLIPVPGHGAGVMTPEGNLASWIDRLYLPGALRNDLYDNEGILSTFPAVATTLLGVLSGHWLMSPASKSRKATGLGLSGLICLALGLLWNTVFPINKLLWTSSYVLYAGGWSLLHLAVFYWLIDVRGYRKWAFPFVVIGMNSITVYFAGAVFDFGRIATIFLYEFNDLFGPASSLIKITGVLAVKWLLLYYLYRRRIFLKA